MTYYFYSKPTVIANKPQSSIYLSGSRSRKIPRKYCYLISDASIHTCPGVQVKKKIAGYDSYPGRYSNGCLF